MVFLMLLTLVMTAVPQSPLAEKPEPVAGIDKIVEDEDWLFRFKSDTLGDPSAVEVPLGGDLDDIVFTLGSASDKPDKGRQHE